jgi:ATP-binding cassette subfamily D (ALD) long-chain fatty acid import protein
MAHSRLITNAEEIAFYDGEELEKSILNRTYSSLIKHINSTYRIRIAYNMFEDFVIKYCWSAVGLMISSIPVFFPEYAGSRTKRLEKALENGPDGGPNADLATKKAGSRTQGFITNKRCPFFLFQ